MTNSRHCGAVVTSRRDISSDLWISTIRPDEKIPFLPGQYVTIGFEHDGKLIERPYSVASSPRNDELEFFLELVPGGHLTPHLYDVPVGGRICVRRAAKGRFLFDDKSGHLNHLMAATVTGVAPFASMVREFAEREQAGEAIPYSIVLLHAASVACELGYVDELARLARERRWFRYIPTVSRVWLDPDWKGEVGRAEDIARKYLDSLGFSSADTTAYACGNPSMVENLKALFQRAGFPQGSFKQEVYWVAEKGD